MSTLVIRRVAGPRGLPAGVDAADRRAAQRIGMSNDGRPIYRAVAGWEPTTTFIKTPQGNWVDARPEFPARRLAGQVHAYGEVLDGQLPDALPAEQLPRVTDDGQPVPPSGEELAAQAAALQADAANLARDAGELARASDAVAATAPSAQIAPAAPRRKRVTAGAPPKARMTARESARARPNTPARKPAPKASANVKKAAGKRR